MNSENLYGICQRFFNALAKSDHADLRSLLPDQQGRQTGLVANLLAWSEKISSQAVKVQITHFATRRTGCNGQAIVVTQARNSSYQREVPRFDFGLEFIEGKVASAQLGAVIDVTFPVAVLRFITATNDGNIEGLLDSFCEDALVNDQLRDYWGRDAIAEWAEKDVIGAQLKMAVINTVQHHRNLIVTANVDGNYDKRGLPDPLELSFYFSEEDGKIFS